MADDLSPPATPPRRQPPPATAELHPRRLYRSPHVGPPRRMASAGDTLARPTVVHRIETEHFAYVATRPPRPVPGDHRLDVTVTPMSLQARYWLETEGDDRRSYRLADDAFTRMVRYTEMCLRTYWGPRLSSARE